MNFFQAPRFAALLSLAWASWAQAAPILGLYNTGVDDSGALLGAGQLETHYTITASPDLDFPGPDALTLLPGFPVGPWIAEGPLSRWIAPRANQGTGNVPGRYTYSTSFDLTGLDPTTAQITGNVSSDDSLAAIRLNGLSLGITAGGFNQFHPFSIPVSSPFVDGMNTLEFDVSNGDTGTAANPTGLRVEMTGRATAPNEIASFLTQPRSQTAIAGDIVNFTVTAAGTPPLSYQWRFNGAPIRDAIASTYTLIAVTTNDAGSYSVTISNAAGVTNSADANLTVLVPFPGVYNTGVDDHRAVLADGATDPHYKLTVNAQDPAGADALALTGIPSPPWIANSNKSRWIGPLPEATAAPGNYSYQLLLDLTGYDPASAFLAGSWATDDGGFLFLNGADTGFKSAGFGGLVEFSLTTGFISGTNALEFRVVNVGTSPNPTGLRVENLRGTARERAVIKSAPSIVTHPKSASRIITASITFTVVADGTLPLAYQWFHGAAPLDHQTNASLAIDSITPADAGDYRVRISNALGAADSQDAQLAVIQPQPGVFNTGVDNIGKALASGQPDPHYVLMASPDVTYAGPRAYAGDGLPIPPWVANEPGSRWITPRPSASESSPGSYQYRLFFLLSSEDAATASITADVSTDDGNGGIFLNGNKLSFGASGFTSYSALNIPAGSPFVEGLNTLDFFVVNGGTEANPTGLHVRNVVLDGAAIRPFLSISSADTGIRIAWAASAAGYVLQETAALPGGWVNSSAVVNVEGDENAAVAAPEGAAKFYRLSQ